MKSLYWLGGRALVAVFSFIAVLGLLGGAAGAADAGKLQMLVKEGVGYYLADSKGMTLYIFTKDQGNKNSCTGDCLKNWPIFHAAKITSPAGSDQKEYGEFTRADGAKQSTFKGWPLYYFAGDKAQGETKGQGVKQVWYIINPVVMKACD